MKPLPVSKPDLVPAKLPPETAEEMVLDLVKALAFYAMEWDDAGMVTKEGCIPEVKKLPSDALYSDAGKRAAIALITVNNWTKRRTINAQAARRREAKTVRAR